VHPNCSA